MRRLPCRVEAEAVICFEDGIKDNSKMTLREVLMGVEAAYSREDDPVINEVGEDSREVGPGALFFAVEGRRVDGHDYLQKALDAGAEAVVVSREVDLPEAALVVQVENTRAAFAQAAANLYGRPADKVALIGVTGTNGKTTVCYLLEAILWAWSKRPGVLGTVSYRVAGETHPAPYTTPTPPVLHATLREMVEAGCTHVLMEVSSHALEMERVLGLNFTLAGFTNLTQDHLDLHGDMQGYLEAKQRLFRHHLKNDGVAVAWGEDPSAHEMLEPFKGKKLFCSSRDSDADILLLESSLTLDGLAARIQTPDGVVEIRSQLLGSTNLKNILLAVGMAHAMGVSGEAIEKGIRDLKLVPGRLERVDDGAPETAPTVLVDYAHTPDAIEQVVATLRPLASERLMVVFGCGGDRDNSKRPLMGKAAAGLADITVVTSDNPRTEDPMAIIEMALAGVEERGKTPIEVDELSGASSGYVVIPERREAIRAVVRAASAGDVVLIAGKGHEDYQILGTRRIHFDDREEARAVLEEIGAAASRRSGV